MAQPLKYMYNPSFFERLCPILKANIPGFDCNDFIVRIFNNQWPDLELKERVRHITGVLHYFLPEDFPVAANILVKLSQALRNGGAKIQGFELIFLADYIEVFGRQHPDESLDALGEITRLVSAEFAIRPFIITYEEKTMKVMLKWSKSKDEHVRRLASEGCRPRLPWAMGLPKFKNDPSPILPILENLKEDPSEYVRRSIANNLNDIAKDHPGLVLNIARRWAGKNADTDRIIRHACRTLLKRGDEKALNLHGFNPSTPARIDSLSLTEKKVKIGGNLGFEFGFINRDKRPANFRLEYAIDYKTSTGKTSRKVFKILENNLEPGKKINVSRRQSFKDFTTRKHYKGKHLLTILANGKKMAATEFMVC